MTKSIKFRFFRAEKFTIGVIWIFSNLFWLQFSRMCESLKWKLYHICCMGNRLFVRKIYHFHFNGNFLALSFVCSLFVEFWWWLCWVAIFMWIEIVVCLWIFLNFRLKTIFVYYKIRNELWNRRLLEMKGLRSSVCYKRFSLLSIL